MPYRRMNGGGSNAKFMIYEVIGLSKSNSPTRRCGGEDGMGGIIALLGGTLTRPLTFSLTEGICRRIVVEGDGGGDRVIEGGGRTGNIDDIVCARGSSDNVGEGMDEMGSGRVSCLHSCSYTVPPSLEE